MFVFFTNCVCVFFFLNFSLKFKLNNAQKRKVFKYHIGTDKSKL